MQRNTTLIWDIPQLWICNMGKLMWDSIKPKVKFNHHISRQKVDDESSSYVWVLYFIPNSSPTARIHDCNGQLWYFITTVMESRVESLSHPTKWDVAAIHDTSVFLLLSHGMCKWIDNSVCEIVLPLLHTQPLPFITEWVIHDDQTEGQKPLYFDMILEVWELKTMI